jgi:putative transposase
MLKSITASAVFRKHPEVKHILLRGEFWSDGYFVNTISKFKVEETITKYVKEQGIEKEYKVLYKTTRLTLF